MRKEKSRLEKILLAGVLGLAGASGYFAYNLGEKYRNDLFESSINNPASVKVGFEDYAIAEGTPIYTEGANCCGVCIFYNKDGEIGMAHYGFKSERNSSTGKYELNLNKRMDMSYIEDIINILGGRQNIVEVALVGGSNKYLLQIKNELARLNLQISSEYSDNIRPDVYNSKNVKSVLALPDGKVYIKKNGKVKKLD